MHRPDRGGRSAEHLRIGVARGGPEFFAQIGIRQVLHGVGRQIRARGGELKGLDRQPIIVDRGCVEACEAQEKLRGLDMQRQGRVGGEAMPDEMLECLPAMAAGLGVSLGVELPGEGGRKCREIEAEAREVLLRRARARGSRVRLPCVPARGIAGTAPAWAGLAKIRRIETVSGGRFCCRLHGPPSSRRSGFRPRNWPILVVTILILIGPGSDSRASGAEGISVAGHPSVSPAGVPLRRPCVPGPGRSGAAAGQAA